MNHVYIYYSFHDEWKTSQMNDVYSFHDEWNVLFFPDSNFNWLGHKIWPQQTKEIDALISYHSICCKSLVMNKPAAEKAASAWTDVGGTDFRAS